MSLVVSTPQQICNSPLNTSKAKMLFSFPKAPKFGVDPKPVCAQAFYDLPPVRESRTASFGYGHKYDFTKSHGENPAPNTYKPADLFQPDKKKGFSFGLSREAMAVTGGSLVGDKNSPGPGAYDTREVGKVAIAYTFKSRTPSGDLLTTKRYVPGPGAYPTYETITPKGKYFISKFKNAKAPTFAPPRSARFPSISKDNKAPGPGAYDLTPGISPKGEYFVSKFRDSLARSFGHCPRSSSSQSSLKAVPGPGSYRQPSDFGYYESAHAANKNELSGVKNTDKKFGNVMREKSPQKQESA